MSLFVIIGRNISPKFIEKARYKRFCSIYSKTQLKKTDELFLLNKDLYNTVLLSSKENAKSYKHYTFKVIVEGKKYVSLLLLWTLS